MTLGQHCPREAPTGRGSPMGRRLRPCSVAKGRDAWAEDMNTDGAGDRQAAREAAFTGKVSLRRIRLNSEGYDPGGAYWGHYQRLYSALSDCGVIDMTMRAANRDAAKAKVRETAPGARFYR